MTRENDKLTQHDYDGIKEYDNPLPAWWLWAFFLTIIFSFIYYLHYEIAGGPNTDIELRVAMERIDQMRAQHQIQGGELVSEADLMEQFQDGAIAAAGGATYDSKCAACHGPAMEGMIGPNLTDRFWIYGKGTAADIIHIIQKGIPDKGMPPWEGMLKKEELVAVGAYIYSKRGSMENQGKEPQGEEVKEYY